jgi:ribosomal-protein-alanine N-acetyltransferase
MFLEVRDDNQPAIRLYERHGFQLSSRRRGYYADPPADALVLARDLPPT